MYIKIINNNPVKYSILQLRKDNPQVSFSNVITEDILTEYNVYPLQASEPPYFDSATQRLLEDVPVLQNNKWIQTWKVMDLPSALVIQNRENKAYAVRSERDSLLAKSDWIVVKSYEHGVLVPEAWASYRQALRDITNQPGFPFEVTWPTKSE
jgi:hypothetical protein